ncbi:MAG: SURF1 family protein [Novosphingobium sp.]
MLSTIVVLIAVGIMIRLGFWQLERLHQKEALLARYAAAHSMSSDVGFPRSSLEAQPLLYRHSALDCPKVSGGESVAGRSAKDEMGIGHIATCILADGTSARIVLGWSRNPKVPDWRGGMVAGIIAPGPRLVADPPLAGLQANARPDPSDLPNNHFSYAVQWFLFAGVALVIYVLAVRKRLAGDASHR